METTTKKRNKKFMLVFATFIVFTFCASLFVKAYGDNVSADAPNEQLKIEERAKQIYEADMTTLNAMAMSVCASTSNYADIKFRNVRDGVRELQDGGDMGAWKMKRNWICKDAQIDISVNFR